jgi:AraC family transcriptional regulator, transcriptional activator of pobA
MKAQGIPNYYVYGEPVRESAIDFFHVELVSTRKSLHRGRVVAHKHPHLAQITFWLKGGGVYQIEDQSWTFSAPAVSFVASGVVHGFSVTPQSDAVVLSVNEDALKSILGQTEISKNQTTFVQRGEKNIDWDDLEHVMKMLQREYERQQPFASAAMLHLMGLSLSLIARLSSASEKGMSLFSHSLAERLQKMVDAHYRDNWTIAQFVDALASTPHLVDKVSQASFEKPVKQLILDRRLLEAKRLLKFTIRSSEDIAAELGFKDPAYFSRAFKRHTTMAPGLWRKTQTII